MGTVTALCSPLPDLATRRRTAGAIAGQRHADDARPRLPLPSNVYPPRAVGRHEPRPLPEISNVVVYLKDVAFHGRAADGAPASSPGARDVRAARAGDHARIDGRVPERRSVSFTTSFRCRAPRPSTSDAIRAGQTPRTAVHEAGPGEGVLPHPLAHERVDPGARPSVFHDPAPRRHLRAAERARRAVHDRRLARARRRAERHGRVEARPNGDGRTVRCRSRTCNDATARQPPRLLVKTLTVTFVTVAAAAGRGLRRRHRQRARSGARSRSSTNLESSQRMFAALETRRQRELRAQAATLAENPTLKAALDTYLAEAPIERQRRTRAAAHDHRPRAREGGRARRDRCDRARRRPAEHARRRRPARAIAGRAAARLPLGAGDGRASRRRRRARERSDRSASCPSRSGQRRATSGRCTWRPASTSVLPRSSTRLAGTRIAIVSDGLLLATHAAARAAARTSVEAAIDAARRRRQSTLDGESYRVPAAGRRSATRLLRARLDRRVVARGDAPDCSRRLALIARRRGRSSRSSAASGWRDR